MGIRGRRQTREEEMRAVLARWERSHLPLSRFAKQEGVAVKTLYRWRRRLGVGDEHVRRGRPPGRAGRSEGRSQVTFTEVSGLLRGTPVASPMFEIVLGSMTVRVSEHFDPDSLRILLSTLREC